MQVIRRRYGENEKTSRSPDVVTVAPPGRVAFWVGTSLILLSFGIYPAYPLVHLLPISLWQKGESGSRWRRSAGESSSPDRPSSARRASTTSSAVSSRSGHRHSRPPHFL